MEEKVNQASELLAKRASQVQRGGARAAVLGVNDGLVSTLCIVIGVAAAGAETKAVLLAGFAGLLAGAISMAAGEWISVRAQVELFEGVLHDLRSIIKSDKALLAANLARNFQEHGVDIKTAIHASKDVAADNAKFLSMYSSQVIGLNETSSAHHGWLLVRHSCCLRLVRSRRYFPGLLVCTAYKGSLLQSA
jgi:NH3-dependent NAD+ synthetase